MSGTVAGAFLGLFFYVICARSLGPQNFGILSVILALSVISSDVFDFGLNTAIVKLLPPLAREPKKTFLRTFLTMKLIISVAQIVIGISLSVLISKLLFRSSDSWNLVVLGFTASGATSLFSFYNSILIAEKKFLPSVALNITANIIRLIIVGGMMLIAKLSTDQVLFAYLLCLILPLPIFIWKFVELSIMPGFSQKAFDEITNFSKWVGGSLILGTISARLDNLILVRLASVYQTGLYSSVQRIFLAFNQLPGASSSVLAPEMSSGDPEKVRHGFRFSFYLVGLFVVGLISLLLIAPIGVPLVLGKAYLPSVVIFQILTIGTLFFVLTLPFNSHLLYTSGKSKNLFGVDVTRFLLVVGLDLFLIPKFGATGAAIAYTITLFSNFVFTTGLYFFQRYKNEK